MLSSIAIFGLLLQPFDASYMFDTHTRDTDCVTLALTYRERESGCRKLPSPSLARAWKKEKKKQHT